MNEITLAMIETKQAILGAIILTMLIVRQAHKHEYTIHV